MLSTIFCIALLLPWASAQVAMPDLSNVTTAFTSAQIVPDVISSFNPMDAVNLTFTDPATSQSVNVVPGILLSMEQTSMPPDISVITGSLGSNMGSSFVVAIVDPDAPTPQDPNVAEFLHFLAGDFSADPTSGLLSNSSPALMEFFPPAPPAGSDPHRYVLLIFNQPDTFDTDATMFVNASTPRTNFSISDFAQAVNLGDAVAGNFFLVGPDSTNSSSSTGTTDQSSTSTTPFALPSVDSSLTIALPTDTSASSTPSPTSNGIKVQLRVCIPQFLVMAAMTIYMVC